MKQLRFISVAIVYVLSLFLVACSLNSPGQPYLAIFVVGNCASGILLGKLLLGRKWHE